MSLITFNFESQYLGNSQEVSIILPDRPRPEDPKDFYANGAKYKVLWLLHGTYGDHTDWVRKSMIEIYAREKNLIVVMPSALNSNYVNWDKFGTGYKMGDFLTEELMPVIHNWFPASDKPEDNFIAGLSMGGGGTLKYLLAHPDKFGAGAILSSAPTDPATIDWDNLPARTATSVKNAGGKEAYLASIENTWDRFIEMAEAGTLPKMMFACGDQDQLAYKRFCTLKALCQEKGYNVKFWELPNLAHEWRFWDPAIQEALKFFELDDASFFTSAPNGKL